MKKRSFLCASYWNVLRCISSINQGWFVFLQKDRHHLKYNKLFETEKKKTENLLHSQRVNQTLASERLGAVCSFTCSEWFYDQLPYSDRLEWHLCSGRLGDRSQFYRQSGHPRRIHACSLLLVEDPRKGLATRGVCRPSFIDKMHSFGLHAYVIA